jgi:hypothetical protein
VFVDELKKLDEFKKGDFANALTRAFLRMDEMM